MERIVVLASRCLSLCVAIALAVRLTVKDATVVSGMIFYASPLPVLMVVTAITLAGFLCLKQRRPAWRSAILLVILSVWWVAQDWRFSSTGPTQNSKAIQVLYWNVARRGDLSASIELIRSVNADIIGLAEVAGETEERRAEFRTSFPDYSVSVMGGGLYLLTRGESSEVTAVTLDRSSIARLVTVRINGEDWPLAIVDIFANPLRSRARAFTRLQEVCDSEESRPLIVMGDFNTPPDSFHLHAFREKYRLVFDVVGQGYSGTWPVPVPLMQLDHIWVSNEVAPVSIQKRYSFASDHALLEAVIQK